MISVLAIDPGSEQSAFAWFGSRPQALPTAELFSNHTAARHIASFEFPSDVLAIEFPFPRGMPASSELFRTVMWVGRFIERWGVGSSPQLESRVLLINRHDVKLHHCGNARAKDSNIRAAIIDRYGGKESAIGKKKTPGPLYGVRADEWQALAIALMVRDNAGNRAWIDERRLAQ